MGRADSDVPLDFGLCAGTCAGVGAGAGTGRSGSGAEERRGVGEGGSIRFWECLVLNVARDGKCCVPFWWGRVETTGGSIPSLPGAGAGASTATVSVLCVCTLFFLYSACIVVEVG